MDNALLHHGLEYWSRNAPGKIAIAVDDESLTYEALACWSDGIAAHLQELGVVRGDRLGLIGAASPVWIASVFGILKAGGTIVPFNDRLANDDLAHLLDVAALRAVIADANHKAIIDGFEKQIPIVLMDQLGACRAGAPRTWAPAILESRDLAMIIFTSGSTGRPKGVMISHERQMAKYYEMMLSEPTLGPTSRVFIPLPVNTASGTQWGFMFATTLGATIHCTRAFDPERALETLVTHKITSFQGISMMFDRIARSPHFAAADLSSIVFAQAGGMRTRPQTLQAWRSKGVVMRMVYGLTEIGGVGIMATAQEAMARPDSCGRGMIYTRLRVVRQDGSDAAPNEAGDVLMRCPGMMIGYWRNPEATSTAIIDGWMHTGDVGVRDEQGYFTFMDRRKDTIAVDGRLISPSEIEATIMQLDDVIEVAVAGVPDADAVTQPCAWVYGSAALERAGVLAHCRSKLAEHKIPTDIVMRDAPLPRMMSGKIDRSRLVK